MGFLSWVEETRKKPIEARRRIASSIVLTTVLVVGAIWLVGFLIHLSITFNTEPNSEAVTGSPIQAPYGGEKR